MTGKKIFINVCLGLIVFSLFILFFLKPKSGSQFERIDIKPTPIAKSTPNSTSIVTVEVSPIPTK